MFDPHKINVVKPVSHLVETGDLKMDMLAAYHAEGYDEIDHTVSPEQRAAIIREEYARTYPWLTEYPTQGRCYQPRFMGYNYSMPHNTETVWFCLKGDGVSMLPLFPFFQYFLDFADPYRKIALLVEEDDAPWQEAAMTEQNRLLAFSGWTVYRIPKKVAETGEASLLPESMSRCPYGEFDDDEQREEYESYKPRLSRETVDGFVSWLKETVYQNKPN